MRISSFLFASILLLPFLLSAEVTFSGQLRERSFSIKKSPAKKADKAVIFNEMRTRLAADATPGKAVHIRFEMQDSRRMGSEPDGVPGVPHTAAIGDDEGLSLHQAFVDLELAKGTSFRLGRQKVALGSQRLLSSLEWHQNARTFDGLRFNQKIATIDLSLLSLVTKDTSASVSDDEVQFHGFFASMPVVEGVKAELYSFYDRSRLSGVGLENWDLVYVGQRVQGEISGLLFEEEFIYQGGAVSAGGKEYTSNGWQAALRLGYKTEALTVNLGYDAMSGDKSATDDKFGTYMNNYAFAHAYYGWMDYLLVNKKNTGGKGVQDIRADAALKVGEKSIAKVVYHYLMPQTGDGKAYGQEVDMEFHGKWFSKANIVFGAGLFAPGAGVAAMTDDGDELSFQFYLMPVFNF